MLKQQFVVTSCRCGKVRSIVGEDPPHESLTYSVLPGSLIVGQTVAIRFDAAENVLLNLSLVQTSCALKLVSNQQHSEMLAGFLR